MTNCVQPIIFVFLTTISCTIASRNFNIIFTDVKCIIKGNYLQNVNCTVDMTATGIPQINVCGQMKKEIKLLRIDFYVDLLRQNRASTQIFKITNLDGCTLMNTNITSPLQVLLRDVIAKYGNPTGCPIRAGYMYVFRGITVDPKYLPEFVPEADFRAGVILYDKKVKYWQAVVYGRISHVNKNIRGNYF